MDLGTSQRLSEDSQNENESVEHLLRKHDIDADEDVKQQFSTRRNHQIQGLCIAVNLLLLGFIITITLGTVVHHTNTAAPAIPKRVSCSCGKSLAEAIEMGCKYDTLAACWLPDVCRDDELSAEFDKSGTNPNGSWTYYADKNRTRELTLEEVSMLPGTTGCFWASQRWHVLHCSFYWRKLWRQRETGVKMEEHYDSIGHIAHCEKLFLSHDNLEGIVTAAAVGVDGDGLVLPKGDCEE